MKIKYLFIFLLVGFTMACGDDDGDVCETADLTYNNDIASIINSNCATAGCHNADAAANATFPMTDFAEVTVAVGFDRIVGAISHSNGFSAMPKNGDKLDQCVIDKVTQWIADGAPE